MITNLDRNDSGKYTCYGRDDDNNVWSTAYLVVNIFDTSLAAGPTDVRLDRYTSLSIPSQLIVTTNHYPSHPNHSHHCHASPKPLPQFYCDQYPFLVTIVLITSPSERWWETRQWLVAHSQTATLPPKWQCSTKQTWKSEPRWYRRMTDTRYIIYLVKIQMIVHQSDQMLVHKMLVHRMLAQ